VEFKIVNVTETNFDQIPRPARKSYNCQECFYWIGKRDSKFDLARQKKRWFEKKFVKHGFVAKMVLWGKEKKPVGYIQFGPIAEFQTAQMLYREGTKLPKNGWCITCITLQGPYQRKGVAKKLVRNVLSDLKKRGVRTVDTYELPKFWPAFGFERIFQDEKRLIMRKKLT
jgi:ribosomal protein S18 acetylase RimI-like enzyme